jgi:hypothetical protein
LASIANSEALACLANMEYRVRKEQVRDKIKSSATGRLNYNDEILKVSVSPLVTGGILENLVQISVEARRRGKEKYCISKLFSKDELLVPIINKGIQVYEKRICGKLINTIGDALKLSDNDEVKKIVRDVFRKVLNAIESRNSATAPVGKNASFDD